MVALGRLQAIFDSLVPTFFSCQKSIFSKQRKKNIEILIFLFQRSGEQLSRTFDFPKDTVAQTDGTSKIERADALITTHHDKNGSQNRVYPHLSKTVNKIGSNLKKLSNFFHVLTGTSKIRKNMQTNSKS